MCEDGHKLDKIYQKFLRLWWKTWSSSCTFTWWHFRKIWAKWRKCSQASGTDTKWFQRKITLVECVSEVENLAERQVWGISEKMEVPDSFIEQTQIHGQSWKQGGFSKYLGQWSEASFSNVWENTLSSKIFSSTLSFFLNLSLASSFTFNLWINMLHKMGH